MTVSNVLNGKNKENWPSTARRAAKIREIAEKLNYRPNAAAKAVVTGRFGGIGLLSSLQSDSGSLFPSTLRAIRAELTTRDLHLTMGDLPDEKLTSEGFVPKILREWAADALLISYIASIPPKLIDLIAQHHIPSIWLNTKLAADCVFPDDVDAGQRATKHLLDLGHHKIAYLYPIDSSHYSVTDRRDGYLKAMRRAKVKPQMFGYEGSGVSMRWNEASQAWLARTDRPTAVVAYEAKYAIPVLCAALELGLKVPRDLSIIAMHDTVVLEPGFPMTTMLIPTEELGRTAVDMVLTKLENPLEELKPQAITFGFEAGTTCAPPLKAK